MKKVLSTAALLGLFLVVHAQQDVLYSQYMFDKMLVNPAAAGSSSWLVGSLKNRTSMMNIEGAPMTNLFTFEMPFQSRNIGVGLIAAQDRIAVTNSFSASGIFSYHIGFGSGKLSFGLQGGIVNNNFDYNTLHRYDEEDLAISDARESAIMPDASTGIFYQHRKFYIGASAMHLFNLKGETPNYDRNNMRSIEPAFYAIGGYMFELGKNLIIEPGFMVKYMTGVPVQADANLSFILLDRFAVGFSYRTNDAVIAMAKIDITRRIRISYSYDYKVSRLANYSSGCHEISLSYGIDIPPPPEKKVIHPRYYF